MILLQAENYVIYFSYLSNVFCVHFNYNVCTTCYFYAATALHYNFLKLQCRLTFKPKQTILPLNRFLLTID